MRILFIASYAESLINFRGELLEKIKCRNHQVFAAAPELSFNENLLNRLNNIGINCYSINLKRSSINILLELKTFYEIYRIIRSCKPDIICSYTIKPNIYTGIILTFKRLFNRKENISFNPMITGLGSAFVDDKPSIKRKIFQIFLKFLYKLAFINARSVIFQNPDDMSFFEKEKIINKFSKAVRVWGSGVNLEKFKQVPLENNSTFLMISRLLLDKGLREYFEAAKIIKSRYPNAKFLLAGDFDDNTSGIKKEEFRKLINLNFVQYLGKLDCVINSLSDCTYFVLPSYREGTPRSILEALAIGRPILTTDVPGCRETVINGVNGYLVKPRDALSLAEGMEQLLNHSFEELKSMSLKSFYLAKEKYDVESVNNQLVEIFEL